MRNFMKKFSMFAFILILLVISITASINAKEINLEGYRLYAQNQKLNLYANEDNGDIALFDKKNNFIWYSNPLDRENDQVARGIFKMDLFSQLLLEYVDFEKDKLVKKNSYIGSVKEDGFRLEKIDDGVKYIFEFPNEQIKIPIEFTIEKDYLRVSIKTLEIEENGNCLVYSLGLLPYMGAGGLEDNGYIVVPDGSGAIINFNNGKYMFNEYKSKIYGEDKTFSPVTKTTNVEKANLPVYGLKFENKGLLSIVTKAEALGTINAAVSGRKSSYNNVYTNFDIRRYDNYIIGEEMGVDKRSVYIYDKSKITTEECEIRIYPLSEEDSNYVKMAKKYREYLFEEKGLTKKSQKDTLFYVDVYGGIRKTKTFLGIPIERTQVLTNYSECMEMLKDIKNEGIENVVLTYNNWSDSSIKMKIPTGIDTSRKLGGNKEFDKLLDYVEENDFEIYPNIDFVNFKKTSKGFSRFYDATKTISKSPALQFFYKLSTFFKDKDKEPWYLLSPKKVYTAQEKFTENLSRHKIENISIDGISKNVYSSFTRNESDRNETELIWEKTFDDLEKNSNKIMGQSVNAYALEYIDHLSNIPMDSSNYDIEDEAIPFYQIVIHGIIPYSTPSLNLHYDDEELFLKAIEYGALLHYTWTYRDSTLTKDTNYNYLYSSNYKVWLEIAADRYNEIKTIIEKVGDKMITNHEKIQNDVFKTEYENGIKTIVNYGKAAVKVDDYVIEAKGYVVIEGSR